MDEQAGKGKDLDSQTLDFQSLGGLQALEKNAIISVEKGDRTEEGNAYRGLSSLSFSLGDFRKANEYHKKHLKIKKKIGDKPGKGRGYGNLGNAYRSLDDFRKAIDYQEK